MGKKYLETKEKSLESSVLGIWQEAAKKADELDEAKFSPKEIKMAIGVASDKRYAGGNMTGAVKAIEKMKKPKAIKHKKNISRAMILYHQTKKEELEQYGTYRQQTIKS